MTLMDAAKTKVPGESWSLLSFATRCLEFLVPSPSVCRDLATTCLEMMCGEKPVRIKGPGRGNTDPQEALAGLLTAADENQRTIRQTIQRVLIDKLNSTDMNRASVAAELALQLYMRVHLPARRVRRS